MAPTPPGASHQGRAPLHVAAAAGKVGLLRLLLDSGADAQLPDATGRTALHLAVTSGTTETVAWLVQRPEVDVQRPDRDGMTALHAAAQAGRAEAVELLLPKSGDIDTADGDGWTALMLAAQGGHAAIVETLLHAGADPRRTATRPVMHALQAAAEVGHADVVYALLEQQAMRADLDTGTDEKPPALVLAVRNAQFGAALRLLDAGAKVRSDACDPDSMLAAVIDYQQRRAALSLPMLPAASGLMQRLIEAGAQRPAARRSLLDRASAASAFMHAPVGGGTIAGAASRSIEDRGVLHYAWMPLLDDWYETVLRWVNPIDGKLLALPQSTLVEYTRLPWYDDVVLLKLTDRTWQPANLAIYYLATPAAAPTALYRLNGTSPPIHEVNAKAPIRLDESNVLAYMRFFCFFVRGDEGPFYVLETPDDPLIPRDVDPKVAALLKDTVRPATFEHREEDGKYFCRAVVWYSNAIFIADMSVHGSGMVDMLDDEPVAGELPTRIDAPIA